MKTNNYVKFYDEFGKPIKNLWQRNGKLYAQISMKGESARFPLEARTASTAIIEVEKIKQDLRSGLRHFPGHCPQPTVNAVTLEELNKLYFASHGYDWDKGEAGDPKAYQPNGSKKDWKTLKNERGHMRTLLKFLPDQLAAKVNAETLKLIAKKSRTYVNPRRKDASKAKEDGKGKDPKKKPAVCGATIDNRIITLGNLMKFGVENKLLSALPFPRQKRPQRYTSGPRAKFLLSPAEVDLLVEKAGSPPKEPRNQLLFDVQVCDAAAIKYGYKVLDFAVPVHGLVGTEVLADRYGVSDVTIRNLKKDGVFPCTLGIQTGGQGIAFYEAAVKARELFVAYLKVLRYTGAREDETSHLRWENVEFETEFLKFPPSIQKRGGGYLHPERQLKMCPELIKVLREHKAKRVGNTPWLFPSLCPDKAPCKENPEGFPQTRWDQQWERVNDESGLRQKIGQRIDAHHLRHYFISRTIMIGVPAFMVAKWVGHSLKMIEKVYGHLIEKYQSKYATELVGQL